MDWNPQLELAEQYLRNTNVSIFLTGKAGTGKTTFLRHITQTLNKRYVVVAPTGVAAINAQGVTIHSLFQLPFCPYLPDVKDLVTEYQMPDAHKKLRKNKIDILRTLDLLIIDEISMVRADLLDSIDNSLRRYRRSQRPFGGVQLLMIGDIRQLPPVVTDDEKPYMDQVYPSPFFFHSKALQRIQYVTIQLTKIYRQQDQRFVDLLNNIRDNRFDRATLDALNRRYIPGFDGDGTNDYIRLTTHNHQADSVNRSRMAALPGKATVVVATVEGKFPESSMPVDQHLELKVGEQVMFVKNDSSGAHRYYNGKIGTIEAITKDDDGDYQIQVRDTEGNLITASRETWENIKYEIDPADKQIKQTTDGTFTQYPLRPAWAITIHKAQGLTFDHVIVDAAAAFSYGQVYVALSRCRSYEGLVLSSPITAAGAIASDDINAFDRTLPSETQVRDALQSHATQYYFDTLQDLFDVSGLLHHTERLRRLFMERLRRTYPAYGNRIEELCHQLEQLSDVSSRFRNQLLRLSTTCAPGSPAINDRVAKAALYYDNQLQHLDEIPMLLTDIEIDNKEVKQEVDDNNAQLTTLLRQKKACLFEVLNQGFDVERHLAAKAKAALDEPKPAARERRSYRSERASTRAGEPKTSYSGTAAHPRLIGLLARWRKQAADDQEVPAYVVMHQKTLMAIADRAPQSFDELRAISGMGKVKCERYGDEILQIVQDYLDEEYQ